MFSLRNWLKQRPRTSARRQTSRTTVPLALLTLEDRVTPASLHWLGTNSSQWSTAANWAENRVPVSGDTLIFDTTFAGFAATAGSFAPQNDLVGLTNVAVAVNDASSAGDFAIAGNAFGLATTGTALSGTVSVGTTATIANNLTLGANTTANVGFGTVTLSGIVSGGFALTAANGLAGTLALNGANTFNGGATVASGTLAAGNNAALGTGTLTLSGGTLTQPGANNLPNAFVVTAPSAIGGGGIVQISGNGTLNADLFLMNNGFLTLSGALSGTGGLIEDGAFTGSTILSGTSPNTFTGGVTVISGGVTLQKTAGVDAVASAVTVIGSSGRLTINQNNQLNDGVAVSLGLGSTLSTNGFSDTLMSLTGLGNLNTGGSAVNGLTVAGGGTQQLTGQVTGSGQFAYTGSGTYTLGGSSTSYTGTLIASAGTLNVAANFSGATVQVGGGTLGGAGAVARVTSAAGGGTVDIAGTGTAGTLNTATNGANDFSAATFRVSVGSGGASDHLALAPNATLSLTNANLVVNASGTSFGGPYQIITSPTGGISGEFNGLTNGATFTAGGQTFQINYTASAVTLTVVSATLNVLHWTGAVSSAWGTAGNWTENRVPTSGDTLVFDTSAPGFAATAAAFAPVNGLSGLTGLSIVINDNSSAGDFNITGNSIGLATATLVPGSVTALISNVLTGTDARLATPLNLTTNVLASVRLGTLTVSGTIGGAASLLVANAPSGTLVLSAANSYTNGTTVSSGTLSVGNNASLGSGTLTLSGGTLANSTAFIEIPNAFVVTAPSTIGGGSFFDLNGNGTLNADLRLTNSGFLELNGALSGTGGLIEDGFPGGTTLGGTAANTFTGPVTIISGRLTLAKSAGVDALVSSAITLGGGAFPNLVLGANDQLGANTTVGMRDASTLNTNGFSDSIAGLSGTGSINTGSSVTNGLTVTGGAANVSRAAVSGSGLLTFSGTGSLTLGGASSGYTGTLTASTGSLTVAGDFSGAAGLAVSGGTLAGTGLLGTLKTGGTATVNPGGVGAGGILTTRAGALASTLTGETLRIDLTDLGPSDQLVVGAGATLDLANATLSLNVLNSTGGTVFPIVTSATGGITGTFAGLANGTSFTLGGRLFRIDYSANAVTITDRQTIALSPASLPGGEVGIAYSQTITPTGGSGAVTLAVSSVSNTTGLTIGGNGTGTITVSGTPTSAGTVTFTVTPSDSLGAQAGRVYSFTVAPAVALSPTSLPSGIVGTAYNQAITSTGGAPPVTLNVSGVTNTTGLVINGSGTGTITVTGTPTSAGTVTFTVTPSDANGAQPATMYSFTVAPAVALSPTSLPSGVVGTAYNQTITSTGGSGTVTLTVSGISNPTGLVINGSGTGTITLTGTPTSAGTVSFTVTPSDAVGTSAARTYTFGVSTPIVTAPTTLPGGEVGFAYSQTITSTGGTAPVTLAVSGVTNTTGLTISGSGTGTITLSGTPTSAGTVTFTVTPTDANGPQPARMYSFTVAPAVALTPTSLPGGVIGTAYNRTITSTGGTAPVTLAVSSISNTTGLMIGGSGTGTITVSGTPTSAGTVTFTVTPTDAFGVGAATTYSFAVNAPPPPPAPTAPTPAVAPAFYTNAFVVGTLLVLQGSGVPGGMQILTVPLGTTALFTDLNGDGRGDLALFLPNLAVVLDGSTGRFLLLIADTNGDGVREVTVF